MNQKLHFIKKIILPTFLLSLLILVIFSCVSPKKYKAKLAEVERKEQENERIKRQFYEAQKLLLQSSDSLKEIIVSLQTKDYQLDSLQKIAKKTVEKNNLLNKELQEKEVELTKKENEILGKEKNISTLKNKQYQRQRQSNELQKSIKMAFSSLNKESFSVKEKSGRLYISLSNKLLFETASIDINSEGRKALQKLASLLKNNASGLDIWVEGHTDNMPVTGAELPFKDNWQLSALRASVVVQLLVENGIAPQSIVAAGHGEHLPIASNKTAEGKSENRRIEIVVLPKLDEIFELLEK
ncbi:OmpA family protein [Bernardetia sp. Wsw4-3y2]|uniref:OmpA family protein n=1 Tax=Bernardetia sp. Wsw4-3y2 TaxID=3127471 RepID=UPI0030CFA418